MATDQTPEVKKMSFTMQKRDGLVFSGDVLAVSSENEVGQFDVLPYHENFVCTVNRYVVVHLDGGLKKEFEIEKGLLRVESNRVEIYIGF
jgi:F0F1-type ATP synthase epsilon subunit